LIFIFTFGIVQLKLVLYIINFKLY